MDNNKKKNILLGALIVGIISMTIAFAALTTRLSINGTASVAATSWNIHFFNWQKVDIATGTTGFTNTATSPEVNQLSMSDSNSYITKVEGINVTLNQPGDTAKYTFEIVNDGTIAGKLNNFTKTDTTSNTLVDYVVNCYTTSAREGTAITTDYVLPSDGGKVYCYLQVTYKDQINGTQTAGQNQRYTQNAVNVSLSASWTWVQSDTAASVATGSAATSGGNAATSGGNETPALSNPYATDFSGTYTYLNPDYDGENEEWLENVEVSTNVYLRKNSNGILETCGRFTNNGQFVCLTGANDDPNDDNFAYYDQINSGATTGYVASKLQEMRDNGGTNCTTDDGYGNAWCTGPNGVTCAIYGEGFVECDENEEYFCKVANDSTDDTQIYCAPYPTH